MTKIIIFALKPYMVRFMIIKALFDQNQPKWTQLGHDIEVHIEPKLDQTVSSNISFG